MEAALPPAAHDVAIELDSPERPYYDIGETVRGQVTVNVVEPGLRVECIELFLECEELAAVASEVKHRYDSIRIRERDYCRRLALDEDTASKAVYKEPTPLAQKEYRKLLSAPTKVPVNSAGDLSPGSHTFKFAVDIPDSDTELPPHSPVPTRNGLQVGIFWSLKANVVEAESRQIVGETARELPVHPVPAVIDLPDLSRRVDVTTTRSLGPRKYKFGVKLPFVSIDWDFTREAQDGEGLIVRLGYPEAGIPQGLVKPEFSATLQSVASDIIVHEIRIYLVQRCVATVYDGKEVADIYKNSTVIGKIPTNLKITREPFDISELLTDLSLEGPVAAPFTTTNLSLSYIIGCELEVSQDNDISRVTTVLETPVSVLGPWLSWPNDAAVLKMSSRPEHSAVGPNGENSVLPSYDEIFLSSNTRVIDENTFHSLKRENIM